VFDDLTAVPRAPRLLLGVATFEARCADRSTLVLLDLPELRPARTVRTLVLRDGPLSPRSRGGDRARLEAVRRRALAGRPHRSARPRLPIDRLGMDHLGRRDARLLDVPRILAVLGLRSHGRAAGRARGMNRRDYFGSPHGGVAGGVLAKSAVAQGASANEIRIGMSAAFRGSRGRTRRRAVSRGPGLLQRDQRAGRRIRALDLGGGARRQLQPEPCIRNTIQLLDREKVFFLSNYVGTPTLTRALP